MDTNHSIKNKMINAMAGVYYFITLWTVLRSLPAVMHDVHVLMPEVMHDVHVLMPEVMHDVHVLITRGALNEFARSTKRLQIKTVVFVQSADYFF